MHHPNLISPLEIGSLKLANRVVVPPMVVFRAEESGCATEANVDHYAALRGAGLVIVEATAVSPEGRLARKQLGIFDDLHMAGLSRIAQAIHRNGAKAAIQIHHAGRQTTTDNTFGLPLVAPSPVNPGGESPREMDEEAIERVIGSFAAGALRAKETGFDAVELHFAHGYLGSQFLSPAANLRQDRWGGSRENRGRFLREVFRRVEDAVGQALLVYSRLGVADGEGGGLPLAEGIETARMLEKSGMRLLHVSNGIGLPKALPKEEEGNSYRLQLAQAVRKTVSVPVIGVGGIRTPQGAETALRNGMADLIAVGRGMLADPEWAWKSFSGMESQIRICRNCRLCHHYRHPERCPARS